MDELKGFRRQWSTDQKQLRELLESGTQLQKAKDLFHSQHAVLHSREMSGINTWSYTDEIFLDLEEKQLRDTPPNREHSLLWILWHISRIEDMTMNILIGNSDQLYFREDWVKKLNAPIHHSGNEILPQDLRSLNREVNLDQLFQYRNAVGRGTTRIVNDLVLEVLSGKPGSDQLDRILTEGAVLPEAKVIIEYWSRRKIFQLLLMPPTRHLMVHLNEAYDLRTGLIKSG